MLMQKFYSKLISMEVNPYIIEQMDGNVEWSTTNKKGKT